MNAGYQYYKGYFSGLDYEDLKGNNNKESINRENNVLLDYVLPKPIEREALLPFEHFRLRTTNPGLLAGTGYTHEIGIEGELKLGFSFDHTTGVPFIPGSSIKGIIRAFFPKFTTHLIGEKRYFPENLSADEVQKAKMTFLKKKLSITQFPEGLTEEKYVHQLELFLFEGVDPLKTDAKDCFIARNQVVTFFDAFPVSIRRKPFLNDSLAPHKGVFEDPIPLPFLKVSAGIEFEFTFLIPEIPDYFQLNTANNNPIELILNLFKEILLQSGIGAKTNVGYGRMEEVKKETQARVQQIPQNIIQADELKKGITYKGTVTDIQDERVKVQFTSEGVVRNKPIDYHNTVFKEMKKIKNGPVSQSDSVTIKINADYEKHSNKPLNFQVTKNN